MRRIFAVVAVSWLNLAVLPCAVAFEIDKKCPHRPSGEQHEFASHHSDHESRAGTDCTTMQADCCELDDATIKTRDSNEKNQHDDLVHFSPDQVWQSLNNQVQLVQQVRPPDPRGRKQSIQVLYCVYLD